VTAITTFGDETHRAMAGIVSLSPRGGI
jgi:hypothetical protein